MEEGIVAFTGIFQKMPEGGRGFNAGMVAWQPVFDAVIDKGNAVVGQKVILRIPVIPELEEGRMNVPVETGGIVI